MRTKENSGAKMRVSLTVVICVAIILINLATTTLISVINYRQYLNAMYDVHTSYTSAISHMLAESIPGDEWAWYARKVRDLHNGKADESELTDMTSAEGYTEAADLLQQLMDSLELSGVTVFTVDEARMDHINEENFDTEDSDVLLFMMDLCPSSSDEITYAPGDTDGWWSTYEDFEDYRNLLHAVIDGQEEYCLVETTDDGRRLLTNYYPIVNKGKVVAIIAASGNAFEIEDFLQSFFLRTLFIGLGVTLLLALVSVLFFYRRIVHPLHVIRREAEGFIANGTEGSDRLDSIRTGDEIQALAGSFRKLEDDVRGHVEEVKRVTAEREHISTELNVAARIQEDMLPRVFPPFPDRKEFDIFASMDPAKEVGGDFYDFFFIDQSHLVMVMADVAGKGVPASLFMAISKSLLKTRAKLGGTPAEILRDVNVQLCDGNKSSMFVTVWMAILDLTTGQGVAANAGHEHPIRRSAGGQYELVEYRHSPAIGLYDTLRFREHTFEMKPGDRLFVYTDGLPEATNASDELYGTARILDELNRNADAPLDQVLPSITEDVARFVGDAPQFDDLTMLVFEYHGVG